MRAQRTTQTKLFDPAPIDHPVAAALKTMSAWLGEHSRTAGRGRRTCRGLSWETILRRRGDGAGAELSHTPRTRRVRGNRQAHRARAGASIYSWPTTKLTRKCP